MKQFPFGRPTKDLQLGAFIASPLFGALVDALPPRPGGGRPAKVSPAVALFVGATVAVYDSTRLANTTLELHWLKFYRLLHHAGYEVGLEPPNSQHWHDYRDAYLDDRDVIEKMMDAWRKVTVVMAQDMGLGLPRSDPDYLRLCAENVLFSDGSWFRPASELGYSKPRWASRARHRPRVVSDAIRQSSKTAGYPLTTIGIRGQGERRRMILDISIAPGGTPTHEITEVIGRLDRVLPAFGDGAIHGFVYDGAMHGKDHRKIRTRFGILSVNRRVGHNAMKAMMKKMAERLGYHPDDERWKAHPRAWLDLVWRRPAPVDQQWTLAVDGCTHRMGFVWGAMWTVEHKAPNVDGVDPDLAYVRDRWGRPCRVIDVRRIADGRKYRWEVDVKIPCPLGPHVITFDPNRDRLSYWMRRSSSTETPGLNLIDPDGTVNKDAEGRKINLSEQFGIIDQTSTRRFARIYGVRNNAESVNSHLKNTVGLGSRSRTYTQERFLLDVLLVATIHNTLNWEEHRESRAKPAEAA